jgi:cellulose synthase operon protein C
MTEPCNDLVRFADGELDDDRAAAFRAHLATCAACQTELIEAMQLHARLSALPPPTPLRIVAGTAPGVVEAQAPAGSAGAPAAGTSPAVGEISGDTSSVSSARGEFSGLRIPPRKARPAKPRWKLWSAAAVAALVAAVVAAVWAIPPHEATLPVVSERAANPFAALKTRPFQIRFAYADATGYRPVTPSTRGVDAPPPEHIPYDALAELERHHDTYGLAIAQLWNDESHAKVVKLLRGLKPTPAIQNDLAAIESLHTSEDNLEPVLRALEVVQHDSDRATSRAAAWNYALQLETLDLPLRAASAFTAIADEHEPGWSDEARARAAAAADRAHAFEQAWRAAVREGEALVASGTPVAGETLRTAPGLMRAYLYNAVRTAPTRDRVLALAAMAAQLDGAGAPPILGNYVQRIAKLDFARRAPLARSYARALAGAALTPEETRALAAPAPAADVADIVLGGMIQLDAIAPHLDGFRALANATGDPWFALVLARAEAEADQRRGDWLGAEARLRKAEALCTPSVAYQCLNLAEALGRVYRELHRVPLALGVVRAALRTARRTGEWAKYRLLLFQLSDIERFNSSTATARAYAGEVLLMSPGAAGCEQHSAELQVIVGAALLDTDGRAAREALDASLAPRCREPDLAAANYLADIGRLDARAGDLAQLQRWLGALRASHTLTPAQLVFADATEGRLMIEVDRAPGTALLEHAIADADRLPEDATADKARAAAYSTLVFDAARRPDRAGVVALVARELGLPAPTTCAVAMNAEDERAVVVVRGADGKDRGTYEAHRPRSDGLAITEDLAGTLAGCAHVQVMARASLQGQPHVLPAAHAWSYVTGAHRRVVRPLAASPPARRLIVMNVIPPAELRLPTLLAEPLDTSPTVRSLAGREATPTRVLAEMSDATEIQFHTHALVDVGVSDASHLVLSPEPDGRYALTAEAIRGSALRGHPLVVLAACHSAQGARYQHAPWSLPDAFIEAGARAVFAAGTDVPDREAGPFFDRVLTRVRRGADPATALRDERLQALQANPSSWVGDVMLFE